VPHRQIPHHLSPTATAFILPERSGWFTIKNPHILRQRRPGLDPADRQKVELENVVASVRDARENLGCPQVDSPKETT
jgi:hypothetical protein